MSKSDFMTPTGAGSRPEKPLNESDFESLREGRRGDAASVADPTPETAMRVEAPRPARLIDLERRAKFARPVSYGL
jgi:hypothetical protein